MQANPLFQTINVRGEAASSGALRVVADSPLNRHEQHTRYANRADALLTQEAIASMVEVPPQEAWESIRTSFVGLVQQVHTPSCRGLAAARFTLSVMRLVVACTRTR